MDLIDNAACFCRISTRRAFDLRFNGSTDPDDPAGFIQSRAFSSQYWPAQAVMPAVVAVGSLYATIVFFGTISIGPPSHRHRRGAVPGVGAAAARGEHTADLGAPVRGGGRHFSLAAAARGDAGHRLRHQIACRSVSAPHISHLGNGDAGCADRVTLAMQELMHRFLMNAFDSRSAIFAGYNTAAWNWRGG
jgi:hypothetical protein